MEELYSTWQVSKVLDRFDPLDDDSDGAAVLMGLSVLCDRQYKTTPTCPFFMNFRNDLLSKLHARFMPVVFHGPLGMDDAVFPKWFLYHLQNWFDHNHDDTDLIRNTEIRVLSSLDVWLHEDYCKVCLYQCIVRNPEKATVIKRILRRESRKRAIRNFEQGEREFLKVFYEATAIAHTQPEMSLPEFLVRLFLPFASDLVTMFDEGDLLMKFFVLQFWELTGANIETDSWFEEVFFLYESEFMIKYFAAEYFSFENPFELKHFRTFINEQTDKGFEYFIKHVRHSAYSSFIEDLLGEDSPNLRLYAFIDMEAADRLKHDRE